MAGTSPQTRSGASSSTRSRSSRNCRRARFRRHFPSNGCNPSFINLDLTATKRFGKWELGWVGFYSDDLSAPVPNYPKQSQFAMGGLVGYHFGPVILQTYLTTDTYEKHYGGVDTRGWARLIIELGDPFAAPAPEPMSRK